MRKNISEPLQNAVQKTITEWTDKIKNALQLKKQELETYEQKKQELIPILKEAHEQRVTLRELANITGISHATLGRWIKEAQEKEKQQHAEG